MSNFMNPEFKIREVAQRIRATRESVGLTPEEMAEKVGMTSFEYLAYEGGAKDFSFATVSRLTSKVFRFRLFTPMIRAPAFTATSVSSAVWASTKADSPRLWATPM